MSTEQRSKWVTVTHPCRLICCGYLRKNIDSYVADVSVIVAKYYGDSMILTLTTLPCPTLWIAADNPKHVDMTENVLHSELNVKKVVSEKKIGVVVYDNIFHERSIINCECTSYNKENESVYIDHYLLENYNYDKIKTGWYKLSDTRLCNPINIFLESNYSWMIDPLQQRNILKLFYQTFVLNTFQSCGNNQFQLNFKINKQFEKLDKFEFGMFGIHKNVLNKDMLHSIENKCTKKINNIFEYLHNIVCKLNNNYSNDKNTVFQNKGKSLGLWQLCDYIWDNELIPIHDQQDNKKENVFSIDKNNICKFFLINCLGYESFSVGFNAIQSRLTFEMETARKQCKIIRQSNLKTRKLFNYRIWDSDFEYAHIDSQYRYVPVLLVGQNFWHCLSKIDKLNQIVCKVEIDVT